ncbi:MAG: CoA transferase [Steroidobacteraceae bacterium]
MNPLEGSTVLALGTMSERPLCRFLRSLGATVLSGEPDQSTVAAADFLVDDRGLEGLEALGLTRTMLERWNPSLVHGSVTAFGSGNPRSNWRGEELVASAMGGALRLTGEPDRAPVKEARDACTFHADMAAAAGLMAAHLSRLRSGRGQHVDVSIQEVAFSRNVNGVLVWQFDRRKLHRVGGALNYGQATVRCIWKLADGWCFHSLMTGRFGAPANRALSDWIDESGLPNPLKDVDWLSYNRSTLDPKVRAIWESAIDTFFATRRRAEIRIEGRRRGINACVVEEPADVLRDAHLEARAFWAEREGVRAPSRFVAFTGGPATTDPGERHGMGRTGPLAGVRVLDFSWALVGSITTKILGDLGADVIKVESRTRPCLSRLDVQVSASKAGDLDDKPWFAHLNTSKRSLSLDLKRPESREVLESLLGWADVVVENFSPGTMEKLGMSYAVLSAKHPRLVMVSGSVYGQTGPLAQEWGVDGTGGALSGRTFLTGWPDRDPVIPGAVPYGDVIVPYVMAAAVAASLAHRDVHGRGCHIDASMYEICVQQMSGAIADAQRGPAPQRTGNDEPGVLRQGVYAARGVDRWVAVSLKDQDDVDRVDAVCGGRALRDWIAAREDQTAVAVLQAAGIAAGVVQDIEDLMERDVGLRSRGALTVLPHSRLGAFAHVRTPIQFSADRVVPFRAPSMGEHNRDILCGEAGLSDDRYAELEAAGVLR